MKRFIRILSYIKPYKQYAALNIFFNVLGVFFSLFSFLIIIPFLRLLFDLEKPISSKPELSWDMQSFIDWMYYTYGSFFQENKMEALLWLCVLVIVIFMLKNLFIYAAQYFMSPIRNGVMRDLRQNIYNKILALPLSYFSDERKGDIMARSTADVQEVEVSILSTLEMLFREPVMIVVFLGTMLLTSWKLTLFVFITLPIAGLIISRIGASLKRKSVKGQNKLGDLLSVIEESISGLRIIKGFNATENQSTKFQNENDKLRDIQTSILRRRDLASPLSEFLSILVVVIVLWYGGRIVLNEDLDGEIFIFYIIIFSQLITPLKGFASAYYNVQKGMASVERIDDILDAPLTIQESPNPVAIDDFKESISFDNVDFAYASQPVLKNINLKIPKGALVALVGQSGAGKSTIADLIPRFHDPQSGQVTIDGQDIKDLKLEHLRSLLGIVTQDAILFNDTVFNNIAFGLDKVSKEDVIAAAKIANAHDYIMALENGYDSIIGDGGGKLSGGEKQRLTIARAVLKNPPILILDEATSSLDTTSERLVQDALQNLMQNRTSLVIAHRLSTIQSADIIIVMDQGEIAERGTHDELLAKNGIYASLVKMQTI